MSHQAAEAAAKPVIAATDGKLQSTSSGKQKSTSGASELVPFLQKQVADLKTPEELKEYINQMATELEHTRNANDQLKQHVEVAEKVFGPTFHLFSRLPRELQLLVWGHASAVQRIIVVKAYYSEFMGTFTCLSSPPDILMACRDSRKEGLKVYELISAYNHKFYINFSSDTIYLDQNTFLAVFDGRAREGQTFAVPEVFGKLRSLTLDCSLAFDHRVIMLDLFREFPNIESLTLVKNKVQDNTMSEQLSRETRFVKVDEHEVVFKGRDPCFLFEVEHTKKSFWDAFTKSIVILEQGLNAKFPKVTQVRGLIEGTRDRLQDNVAGRVMYVELLYAAEKRGILNGDLEFEEINDEMGSGEDEMEPDEDEIAVFLTTVFDEDEDEDGEEADKDD